MKKTRANLAMVAEDDAQFQRFWNAYPKRVSKKVARHAWAKLLPAAELVDRMIAALAWQVPFHRWDTEKYEFAPYPASWLNGAKWDDEPPASVRLKRAPGPLKALADDWIEQVGYCFHTPRCGDSEVCRAKRAADKAARSLQAT